jgi:hypothetical protein
MASSRCRLHETNVTTISTLEERVRTMEKDMPGVLEVRRWIITDRLATLGVVGTALLALLGFRGFRS